MFGLRKLKMPKIIVCKDCGEEKVHEARGLCKSCYNKQRVPLLIICKNCKKESGHVAKRLCTRCYRRDYKSPFIFCKCCKKRREHQAKGLCSPCYNKQWKSQNPDKVKEHKKRDRKKNKEKIRKRDKGYYQKKKDIIKERMKQYYKNNCENIKIKTKEWAKANPEKVKLYKRKKSSKRRLILEGFINDLGISLKIQKRVFIRDKVCVYCNGMLEVIDHIFAINNGGNNDPYNLVGCCNSCNCSKSDKDVFKWCEEKGIEVPKIVIELLNKQKEQRLLMEENK